MAKEVDEIVVGANGTVWVADEGTAAPANESAVPGGGWTDLGYISEDGVTATDSKDITDINVWQLLYAARKIVTGRSFEIGFNLRQWNSDNVEFAFGGGEVTDLGSAHYKYTPPAPEFLDERAMMIDWADGDKKYRLVIPKGIVSDDVETQLARANAADLSITFAVVGSDDADDPWYLLTNDPAFAA